MEANRIELSAAHRVDPTTIDAWERRGMPTVEKGGKGRPSRYSVPDTIEWRIQTEVDRALARAQRAAETSDLEELKRQKLALEVEARQLELARSKGEVAPIAEHAARQAHVFSLIQANVMSIPRRAVLQLIGETDEGVIHSILREACKEALTQATAQLVDEAKAAMPEGVAA